jgi:hypothetical protein
MIEFNTPRQIALAISLMLSLAPTDGQAQQATRAPVKNPAATEAAKDAQRDFDFHIGTWRTHVRRLQRPLSDSQAWVEYQGTTLVRKVWDGRANLVELVAEGPAGRIEVLSLRTYNPLTKQWSLNVAGSNDGVLSPPMLGGFKDGRAEFFSEESMNGRAIKVRFVVSNVTAATVRFEQAFSADGGKTWETNWIAVDTRIGDTISR